MPPFVRGAPLAMGGRQLVLWHLGSTIFRREQDRAILTGHLSLRVAEDGLSPGAPTRDPAFRVGGEDRVVRCTLDDQARVLGILGQLVNQVFDPGDHPPQRLAGHGDEQRDRQVHGNMQTRGKIPDGEAEARLDEEEEAKRGAQERRVDARAMVEEQADRSHDREEEKKRGNVGKLQVQPPADGKDSQDQGCGDTVAHRRGEATQGAEADEPSWESLNDGIDPSVLTEQHAPAFGRAGLAQSNDGGRCWISHRTTLSDAMSLTRAAGKTLSDAPWVTSATLHVACE